MELDHVEDKIEKLLNTLNYIYETGMCNRIVT